MIHKKDSVRPMCPSGSLNFLLYISGDAVMQSPVKAIRRPAETRGTMLRAETQPRQRRYRGFGFLRHVSGYAVPQMQLKSRRGPTGRNCSGPISGQAVPGENAQIHHLNKFKKTRFAVRRRVFFCFSQWRVLVVRMCAENLQGRFYRHNAALGPFVNGRGTCRDFKTVRIECI